MMTLIFINSLFHNLHHRADPDKILAGGDKSLGLIGVSFEKVKLLIFRHQVRGRRITWIKLNQFNSN